MSPPYTSSWVALDAPEAARTFADNVDLQRSLGLDSQMLTVAEVAALAPYVDTAGLVAGAASKSDYDVLFYRFALVGVGSAVVFLVASPLFKKMARGVN